MTRRSWLPLAVALLLSLAGCLVPSLEDLEQEKERTCDATHECLSGYLCLSGVCKKSSGLDCTPNATQACGEARGECVAGTQTCSEAGAWGTCEGAVGPVTEVCDDKDNDCNGQVDDGLTLPGCGVDAGVCAGKTKACTGGLLQACGAATYGPDYEVTETRCDGLDNDCDGQTDENLPPAPCDRDAGVCAGALRTCTAGSLPACTDATYLAHDSAYEPVETRCDGKDNDCDGLTDSWPVQLVSDGGTPVRRKVAAVVVPASGTAAKRDVLTLFEVGNRVVTRVRYADGTSSAPRYPSVTVTSVAKASAPALGTNGVDIAEAWFEELTAGPVYRLPVALAGPLGEGIAMGSAGVLPIGPLPGPGQKVVVGMTAQRIVLAYAYLDGPTASTSTVALASCARMLDSACTVRTLGAGRNPALLVSADTALVAYETNGTQLSLAKLSVPSSGTVTQVSNVAFGGSSEHDVALSGTLAAVTLWSVVPGTPETLWKRDGDCSGACDPTAFTSTPSVLTFAGSAQALTVAGTGTTRVVAWEDGTAGVRVTRMLLPGQAIAAAVSPMGTIGHRPVVALTGTAGFEVLYDTEGGVGPQGDQVVSRRFCGP